MKLSSLPWEETVRVSRDWAVTALKTLARLPRKQAKPLRFIYMSGHFAPRERTEKIKVLGDNNMAEYGYLRVSGCFRNRVCLYHVAESISTHSRVKPNP